METQNVFHMADQIINSWPKEAFAKFPVTSSTAVAVLTHDPKIDDAALGIVLNTPAFYVGALGAKIRNYNAEFD